MAESDGIWLMHMLQCWNDSHLFSLIVWFGP